MYPTHRSYPGQSLVDVVLIEDDDAVRRRLAIELGEHSAITVVGEASCWLTAERLLRDAVFGLALIDLNLDGRMAHDLVSLASERGKVVVYSIHGDMNAVLRSLADGADGYLHKGAQVTDLAETLLGVMDGLVPISPTVAGHLLNALRPSELRPTSDETPDRLSTREVEVLEWLARGLTLREVGERCGISRNTVSFHTKQIYGKLRVSSRSEAVYEALNSGVISVARNQG